MSRTKNSASPPNQPRRLDALLSYHGLGSRSEVKRLIRSNRVLVNGELVSQAQRQVASDATITVDGTILPPLIIDATLIMHKPVGYSCSHDSNEAPIIDELVPSRYQHLALNSAGRLDRATSGLLLLSTDGSLIHRLSHPRRAVWKRYRIEYHGRLHPNAVDLVNQGLTLGDEPDRPCRPAQLELHPQQGQATMWLHEGRYHQVRRMIAALGGEVITLHRDRQGELDLPMDLAAGDMRLISDKELQQITQS